MDKYCYSKYKYSTSYDNVWAYLEREEHASEVIVVVKWTNIVILNTNIVHPMLIYEFTSRAKNTPARGALKP